MSFKLRFAAFALSMSAAATGLVHCGGGDDSAAPAGGSDAGSGSDVAPSDGGGGEEGSAGAIDVDGTTKTHASDYNPARPVANVTVIVFGADGKSSTTVSGADGSFHVSGIVPPYDVWLPPAAPDSSTGAGSQTYYPGITRTDPQLVAYDDDPGPPLRHASVSFTANACSTCTIYGVASQYNGYIDESGTGAAAPFTADITWHGDVTTTMDFDFVVYQSGNIVKYVSLPGKTVTDSSTLALGTLSFNSISSTAPLQITTTVPADLTFSDTSVSFYSSTGTGFGYESGSTATSSVPIPQDTDWKIQIATTAVTSDHSFDVTCLVNYPGSGVLPNALTVDTPDLITAIAPLDKAVNVPATQKLVWSPATGVSVYVLYFDSPSVSFTLYTGKTEFDLSDLPKLGMHLGSGEQVTWLVQAYPDATSMDDLTQPGGPNPAPVGATRCRTRSLDLHFATQ